MKARNHPIFFNWGFDTTEVTPTWVPCVEPLPRNNDRGSKEHGLYLFIVDVYPGPYCYEKTPEDQKERTTYPYSIEGYEQIVPYLNKYYNEHPDKWMQSIWWRCRHSNKNSILDARNGSLVLQNIIDSSKTSYFNPSGHILPKSCTWS